MSHHSEDGSMFAKALKAEIEAAKKAVQGETYGPTGEFPNGKYGDNDKGEIRFGVAADKTNGKVVIDFGKPIRSLGMTAAETQDLAEVLSRKAWEARGITEK